MSKRKQILGILRKENFISRIRILLIAVLTIIIFYPPYLQGLFFEKHVIPTQIIVFTIFIIFLIYKWLKNNTAFFRTPIDFVCLGFTVVYFISIYVAVHTRSAIIEWLKYCMYFAVFYMVSDLAEDMKAKFIFIWTIIISAAGVAIIGLDAALGGNVVRALNKLYNMSGGQGNLFFGLFADNRIYSTLQYPNALASYMMAVFFITVGLIVFYKKCWQRIILGSIAFILFLTFMLTQSRGAQLLFPIAIIILLVTAPRGSKIKAVTNAILLALPAGILSLFIIPYLSGESLNQKALLLLVIGLIINILVSLVTEITGNSLQRISWKVYAVVVSVMLIIIGIGIYYLFNSSIPIELSLLNSDSDKTISISKDVSLKPNKNYILRFNAESNMKGKKPYAFVLQIDEKDMKNILFGNSKKITRQEFSATDGYEEFEVPFSTSEDTKLVNVNFSIYYAGTSVTVDSAVIVNAETNRIVKKIVFKNKFNLDKIISRFENIFLQKSLVMRAIYYKDGINLFKDRWFLGAGGGSWNYLYRQYQSYNYSSSQAHNYPLQLGIETGILGLFVLICLVLMLFFYYRKYYKKNKNDVIYATIFTAILALLLHSVIDFDFAESSMLLIFWSLIALFNRELIEKFKPEELMPVAAKKKPRADKLAINRKPKYSILAAIIVTALGLYFSSSFSIASSLAIQAFRSLQHNDTETAINKMEKAINLDKYNETYVIGYTPVPTRPDVRTGLIDILFLKNDMYNEYENKGQEISENERSNLEKQFGKAILYLKNIEKKFQNNLNFFSSLSSFYFNTGDIDKCIDYLDKVISHYPFEPLVWHSKINIYYQLMKDCFNNGEYDKAREYLIKGLSVIDEVTEINKRNMNPFILNENTMKLLQTMKFMLDNWDKDGIYDVNKIIFYSMFGLDVNKDGIPDQWIKSNTGIMSIEGNDLSVQAEGWSYLYTRMPIIFENGKTYRIEVKSKEAISNLFYHIAGITPKALKLTPEAGIYVSDLDIEANLSDKGNLFTIYFEEDCVIESILIKKLN